MLATIAALSLFASTHWIVVNRRPGVPDGSLPSSMVQWDGADGIDDFSIECMGKKKALLKVTVHDTAQIKKLSAKVVYVGDDAKPATATKVATRKKSLGCGGK